MGRLLIQHKSRYVHNKSLTLYGVDFARNTQNVSSETQHLTQPTRGKYFRRRRRRSRRRRCSRRRPTDVSKFSKVTTEHVAANTRHNQTTQPKHTTPTKHNHTFTAIRTQHLRRTIILQATNRNQEAQHTRHNHQLTLIALATQIDTTHTSQRNHSTAIIPSMNLRVYETQHIRTQNTSRTLTAQQQCSSPR